MVQHMYHVAKICNAIKKLQSLFRSYFLTIDKSPNVIIELIEPAVQ